MEWGRGRKRKEGFLPTPRLSIRVCSQPARLSLIALGRCNLDTMFAAEAARTGWHLVEQMGSAYMLHSQQGTLTVVARRWFSVFTRLDYYLNKEIGSHTNAAEPPAPADAAKPRR